MNLLAIDSAYSVFSAAVLCGKKIFYKESDCVMKQSEIAMNIIDLLIKNASLKPYELNGIVCMGGPGSFTGLRIGYSIAKGLALSLSIPFAAIPTLECISYGAEDDRIVLAVIQARKNAWFYGFFKNGKRLKNDEDGDCMRISEEINKYDDKIILTGYGSDTLYQFISKDCKNKIELNCEKKGYSKELLTIAKINNLMDNDNTAFLFSGPEYLRKTDAELRNPV